MGQNMSIELDMSNDDKTEDKACHFQELCAALQRNDPNITDIDGSEPIYCFHSTGTSASSPFPKGYGRPLGESLRNNTYVRKLNVNVDHLLPLGPFGAESYTTEQIHAEIHALLDFIATSKTLSVVILWYHYVTELLTPPRERLADELLSAAVRNPSITEVAARVKFYSWRQLHQSLLSARHVKSLNLNLQIEDATSYASKVHIATAIGTLSGLERLSIDEESDIQSSLILAQLRYSCSKQTQLSHLLISYDGTPGCVSALTTYICTSRSLQNLRIRNFPFAGARYVKDLFRCQSLTHLSLRTCRLDKTATETFIKLIRNENRHSIRYLCLVHCDLYATTKKLPKASAEAKLLIESPLEDVTLAFRDRKGNFFHDLHCADGAMIRVRRLRIACDSVDFASFAQFLPSCGSIHELMIDMDWGTNVRPIAVLHVLHQNGSIRHLSEPQDEEDTSPIMKALFSEPMLRRVRAIGKRNELVPKVLADPVLKRGEDSTITGTTDLSLFPKLFAVAQQAPRMAPTNHLIGLLAAVKNSIGPSSAAEKKRSGVPAGTME